MCSYSKALTKLQSVALIGVVVVAAVAGSAAYILWSGPVQSVETIRIGICGQYQSTVKRRGKGRCWQLNR